MRQHPSGRLRSTTLSGQSAVRAVVSPTPFLRTALPRQGPAFPHLPICLAYSSLRLPFGKNHSASTPADLVLSETHLDSCGLVLIRIVKYTPKIRFGEYFQMKITDSDFESLDGVQREAAGAFRR
jgi:hypothetical protein